METKILGTITFFAILIAGCAQETAYIDIMHDEGKPVMALDYRDFDQAAREMVQSMLGSAAIIVIDEETAMLDVLKVVSKFYSHESCGQCTPCRVGNSWINKIVKRMADGKGKDGDIDNIIRLASNILGKTLCPLGDAAAMPILSIANKFRDEIQSAMGSGLK